MRDFFEKGLHYPTTIAPQKSCGKPANRRGVSDEKSTLVIQVSHIECILLMSYIMFPDMCLCFVYYIICA